MNKYLKAISHNLIFFAISTLAFLILTPLAIRIMGDEFFGLWTILFAVAQFANIGTLGIGSIINKFASENNCTDSEASSILSSALIIILPMAFVTIFIIFVFKNVLVDTINPSITYIHQFNVALMICTLSIIPQFINKIFQGYFLSQLKNKFVRTMEFISSIFPLTGGVLITIFEKNLVWLSAWNLFIQIVIFFIFMATATRSIRLEWTPKITTLKRMLGFSTFMFLESSAITLFQQFDRVLVGMTLGSVAAGVYTVATSVGLRLSIITGQATEVIIPYASLKNSLGENEALYQIFRKLSKYISMMIAGLAGLSIIWMREILAIWISPEYATTHSNFFRVLIMAYGFLSLCRPAHQTLTGLGRVQFTSLLYLFVSVIMLTSLVFLSHRFGLNGAAYANVVMVILLAMNLWTYKILNKKLDWRHVFADLKWGILMPIIAYLVILTNAPWYYRAGYSLLLGALVYIMLNKDTFIKSQLGQITQRSTLEKET